jgi:integrating conjugative element protein (TIGR03761 family)
MAASLEISRKPVPSTELQAPGALRSDSYLVLQTRRAQLMVHGRPMGEGKQQIVGLMQFAGMSRSVWSGALADDPYAHWWLVRMHQAIEESAEELKALTAHVEQLLQAIPGLTVTVAQSVEPIRIPLTFTNPYGFRGAFLLAHYDEVVRRILTARHVALVDRADGESLLGDAGRHLRRAYNSVLRYRFLGINAEDIQLMTARGTEAEKLMGPLPAEALDGRLRAPHAPNPRARGFAIPFSLRKRPTAPIGQPGPEAPSDGATAPSDGAADAPVP